MKKFWIGCLSLLAVVSCSDGSVNQKGTDGYIFHKKQYTKNELQITVVEHPSYADLRASAKAESSTVKTEIDFSALAAYSVLQPTTNVCTIHIVDPSKEYTPEFVGHEFLHCVYGQWHIDNKTR